MHFSNARSQQLRVVLLIVAAWLVSAAVAAPLPFVNQAHDLSTECTFTSAVFLLVSSVFSFYIPCAPFLGHCSVHYFGRSTACAVMPTRTRTRERRRCSCAKDREAEGIDAMRCAFSCSE